MTGAWIYTDLISFVRVLGGWMQGGFGITYFQDTAKDMQMKIATPNPLEHVQILIPA